MQINSKVKITFGEPVKIAQAELPQEIIGEAVLNTTRGLLPYPNISRLRLAPDGTL